MIQVELIILCMNILTFQRHLFKSRHVQEYPRIYLSPIPSSIEDAVGSSLIRYNLPSFKLGQTTRTLQTDIALKLDFPDNLCRASFANFALFYTGYGMDYSLNLGRERATHELIVCRHNRG